MKDDPGAIPMLVYADAPAAIDFLCRAFGFSVDTRMDMDDGRVGHCEMRRGGVVLMLSSEFEEMGLRSAKHADFRYSQVAAYVADVDAHHATALEAGATVMSAPADQVYGDRMYRAVDPEGHRWIFMQKVADVPEEEWKAAYGGQ